MTETGLSLGTPHYMSPEQASADRDLSARSDVYSLGCVLYEMIAGQPPHTGPSAQSVLVRIMTEAPRNLTEVRHTVPPHVASVVAKAVEKLPADRFESAQAFIDALEDESFTYTARPVSRSQAAAPAPEAPAAPAGPRWRVMFPWTVAAAGAAWALFATLGGDPPSAPVTRVVLSAPEGQEFSRSRIGPNARAVGLSPDGEQLVYVGDAPGSSGLSQLWRRHLDALEATPIPGTEDARSPSFSRDGAYLSFYLDDRLGVMPADGGTPVWLAGPGAYHAWGDDGAIYFADFEVEGEPSVMRWVPGTARAEQAAPLQRPALVFDVLPGSRAVLVGTGSTVQVLDLVSGEQTELAVGRAPRYLPSGHITYTRLDDNVLLVEPFDPETLTTSGAAVSTAAAVNTTGFANVDFTVAADGTLAYARGGLGGGEVVVWVDRSGTVGSIDWVEPGRFDGLALSPDGTRIAAGWSGGGDADGHDIWVFDLEERSRLPLTRDGGSTRPQWHPVDGRVSYVNSGGGSPPTLTIIAADGSGTPEDIVPFSGGPADGWWIRDGKELLLRMPGVSMRGIFRYVPGEDDAPRPWLDRDFNERSPAPSPDGNWLVYASDQSGRDEVYAQPYPDGGAVVAISIDGGSQPLWSRDGREVFFVGADGYMWSATVAFDASSFRVEARERLFELGEVGSDPQRTVFDVAADGRFLFTRGVGSGGGRELILVRNWVQEVTGASLR
jgi:serine/threonine-protein kinase